MSDIFVPPRYLSELEEGSEYVIRIHPEVTTRKAKFTSREIVHAGKNFFVKEKVYFFEVENDFPVDLYLVEVIQKLNTKGGDSNGKSSQEGSTRT